MPLVVEERGERRLIFWGEVDEEGVDVVVVDVGGVREERLRAALIRTFTVDGILLMLLLLSIDVAVDYHLLHASWMLMNVVFEACEMSQVIVPFSMMLFR